MPPNTLYSEKAALFFTCCYFSIHFITLRGDYNFLAFLFCDITFVPDHFRTMSYIVYTLVNGRMRVCHFNLFTFL